MKKIKVHIDPKGYDQKPVGKENGSIKSRLQKGTSPSLVTVEELVHQIETGRTISPGIMGGMSADDWRGQQLFLIDIDNAEDGPMLTPKAALKICDENNLPVAFWYPTFGYTKERPKFRLAFVMDRFITDEATRKKVISTLVALFPQSDKSCVNADRIFYGTDKRAILLNENARISVEDVERVSFPTRSKTCRYEPPSHTSGRADPELDELVQSFDLFGYMKARNGSYRRTRCGAVFNDCEICKHHGNLMYVKDTNSFSCLSKDVGGSIIDYLIRAEGLTKAQAIHKLKYELTEPEWPQPLTFDEIKLPSFPVDALPAPLNDWVAAVAENTETPADMAAVCTLAMLACAVQGKFRIAPSDTYSEPLNLYILIIANSGERKSPIVKMMTRAIYQYEEEENRRRAALIEADHAKLSGWKKQIDLLEKDGNIEKAAELRTLCRELEQHRTKSLRLIADDVTPEALTSLLSENNGIITIITTEGGLFDTLAGRYSNTVSIDTLLKAYSGDRIRVDRKGRESEVVNDPTMTMLLSAQDNVLEGLMGNDVFKSRGLTARILYCRPKSKMGSRQFNTPTLPKELELKYNQLILELLRVPRPSNDVPHTIRLSPKAHDLITRFFSWIEPKLISELEHMEGWGAKFIGNTLRIAGLLHCAVNGGSAAEIAVSAETMRHAIKIARYFLKHAKCAYSIMGADKSLQGGKRIIKKLQVQNKAELTRYQIFRLCRGDFSKVEDLGPSLELLVDYGYLRKRDHTDPTGGRPRSSSYILNPKYFTGIG